MHQTTYSLFHLSWVGDHIASFAQTDYPSATVSKRYVNTDETGRPIDMWSWPATGDASRAWAIDPSAWAFDNSLLGSSVFQPLTFAGQFRDSDTVALQNNGTTAHRPGIVFNNYRSYDPLTGGYLQADPLVPRTWSSYVYASSDPVNASDPSGLLSDKVGCNPLTCGDSGTGGGSGSGSGTGTGTPEGEPDNDPDGDPEPDENPDPILGDFFGTPHTPGTPPGMPPSPTPPGGSGSGSCGPNASCPPGAWWSKFTHALGNAVGTVGSWTSGGRSIWDLVHKGIVPPPPIPPTGNNLVNCECTCTSDCDGVVSVSVDFKLTTLLHLAHETSTLMCAQYAAVGCLGHTVADAGVRCKCYDDPSMARPGFR